MNEVTRILDAVGQGDPQASAQLLPLVYDELRRLAAQRLAQERPGQTLEATALVHEAYLRLVTPPSLGGQGPAADRGNAEEACWDNRRHFFAAAAEAMRRILVENARRKHRQKRGGNRLRINLKADLLPAPERDQRLLALDEALERFALREPQKAELVKLRSFAGLSLDAAAAVLGISPSTADRWWAYARAWLRVAMDEEQGLGESPGKKSARGGAFGQETAHDPSP